MILCVCVFIFLLLLDSHRVKFGKNLVAIATTPFVQIMIANATKKLTLTSMKEKLSKQSIDTWAAGLKFYTSASSKIESNLTKMKAISLTWYDVLYAVYTKPKKRSRMSDIAQEIILSKSALTRSVDKLVAEGFLKRERSEEDAREFIIEITPSGIQALRDSWPIYEEGIREIFVSKLTPKETSELLRIFRKLNKY
ncbi:MarR family protein [Leptospira borgpetersenii serovar Hardjo-bovis str. Sponselee]|uniref:MarR family protein n=2 Tax=Leptospira borgpetersenii serovar Hardjo-bovis TaxID=338217 RepID=M6CA48_LEPBO|nr:MarR family protein [Leptospira borgpetersenii serovar Hardjo-bovis str. Sponselee]